MHFIGFSTGALAFSDFRLGLAMLRGKPVNCVELSALREHELEPLVEAVNELDLSSFGYVSVHAPSELRDHSEEWAVDLLNAFVSRGWPVIVHPNVISKPDLWRAFGALLFIENMDKRKPVGRTASELGEVMRYFPESFMCFDVGHARQVDPSMTVASEILKSFSDKIRQIHISDVTSASTHGHINYGSKLAFQKIAHLIPKNVPIILESRVQESDIEVEVDNALEALALNEVVAAD